MKNFFPLLLIAGLVSTSYETASAQCNSHPGYLPAAPAAGRYHPFKLDGMTHTFYFDRVTSEIYCDNLKIGVRTPSGDVQLDQAAVGRIGGAGGPAVQPGPVGQPGQPAPIQGAPAGQPAVNGAPAVGGPAVGGAPAAGAPAVGGAPAAGAPAAGVPAAGVQGAPARAPAAPAVNGGAIPAPAPNGPVSAALGNVDPALNPAFIGNWRAENKNILGRTTLRELSIEGNSLTLRVQTAGDEAQVIEGTMEIAGGKLTVKGANGDINLGSINTAGNNLVITGDETLNFSRVEG